MSDDKGMREESDSSFSSRVSLNMVANMARAIVLALVGLLMVPYYIDQFGMEVYGLLPLATSITTYVLIASDSLVSSFSRYLIIAYVLEASDRGDQITVRASDEATQFGVDRYLQAVGQDDIVIDLVNCFSNGLNIQRFLFGPVRDSYATSEVRYLNIYAQLVV